MSSIRNLLLEISIDTSHSNSESYSVNANESLIVIQEFNNKPLNMNLVVYAIYMHFMALIHFQIHLRLKKEDQQLIANQ